MQQPEMPKESQKKDVKHMKIVSFLNQADLKMYAHRIAVKYEGERVPLQQRNSVHAALTSRSDDNHQWQDPDIACHMTPYAEKRISPTCYSCQNQFARISL